LNSGIPETARGKLAPRRLVSRSGPTPSPHIFLWGLSRSTRRSNRRERRDPGGTIGACPNGYVARLCRPPCRRRGVQGGSPVRGQAATRPTPTRDTELWAPVTDPRGHPGDAGRSHRHLDRPLEGVGVASGHACLRGESGQGGHRAVTDLPILRVGPHRVDGARHPRPRPERSSRSGVRATRPPRRRPATKWTPAHPRGQREHSDRVQHPRGVRCC